MSSRKTKFPFVLNSKSSVKFEKAVLQSFFEQGRSEKYDYPNRHSKYFSSDFLNIDNNEK